MDADSNPPESQSHGPVTEPPLRAIEDTNPFLAPGPPPVYPGLVVDLPRSTADVFSPIEDVPARDGGELPAAGEVSPVVAGALPVVAEVAPVVAEVAPVVAEVAPGVAEFPLVVAGDLPVVAEVSAVVAGALPFFAEVAPVVADAPPVVADGPPVVADGLAAIANGSPLFAGMPRVAAREPQDFGDRPLPVGDAQPVVVDDPRNVAYVPAAVAGAPPVVAVLAQPVAAAVPPGPVFRLLAGLESGILGAVVMVAWFAMDSLMERQYWWAMLNLWGASVYHNRVFSMGFGVATLAGASTHFFLHGFAGALWALIGGRMSNYWVHLLCSFAAAGAWYLVLMHAFWPAVAPVVSRISPLPATILAYLLFGAAISRNAQRARQIGLIWET